MRAKRKASWEVEIERQAQVILRQRNEDAYKAAALMVVARKLDEIKAILQAAVGTTGRETPVRSIQPSVSADISTVEHPCSYCGRESVYRTRPHKFNRTGTWLCRAHLPLRRQHEQAQVTDERARDANGVVQEEAPVVALAPEKKDTGADTTADSVMVALGVN